MCNRFIIFLILSIISFPVIAAKPIKSTAVGVTAAKIETAELFDVFNVVGQCKNDNSRDYYANVAGKLEIVSSNQGDKVNKGEVLFIIDRNIAETAKTNAEALLNTKRDEYIRNKTLAAKNFISSQDLERSKSDFENARFNYSKAVKTYNDMLITAPFDGKIGVIKSKPGDDIKQGDYLFSIVEGDGTQSIFVELPESLYGKVSNNTEVIITDNKNDIAASDQIANSNGEIKGKISSVSGYLSDNGTMDAKIILPANSKMMHNSYVNVTLIINPHKNFAVPEQCVQRNNQGNFIYKIDNNIVKQLYVEIGSRANGLIEITSKDIQAGDLVVAEGMTKIDDGTEVTLLENKG
ncbi:efflux RND transporter periplasmic adaptor subunit [Rickettsia endosymbiont of Halotydeus destructor]|uniref:efflux RND transporter periplasmic adaptor subunit n=1 Tax=Rickettsia endosymbiont of Halotydeus destructor TaxID=2996754 RepID=UPI003BAFD613